MNKPGDSYNVCASAACTVVSWRRLLQDEALSAQLLRAYDVGLADGCHARLEVNGLLLLRDLGRWCRVRVDNCAGDYWLPRIRMPESLAADIGEFALGGIRVLFLAKLDWPRLEESLGLIMSGLSAAITATPAAGPKLRDACAKAGHALELLLAMVDAGDSGPSSAPVLCRQFRSLGNSIGGLIAALQALPHEAGCAGALLVDHCVFLEGEALMIRSMAADIARLSCLLIASAENREACK